MDNEICEICRKPGCEGTHRVPETPGILDAFGTPVPSSEKWTVSMVGLDELIISQGTNRFEAYRLKDGTVQLRMLKRNEASELRMPYETFQGVVRYLMAMASVT